MATVLKAGNSTTGGSLTPDSTGILEVKTGTGTGTTAVTIDASQNVTFAGTAAVSTGTLYPLVRGTAKAYNWNGLTTNTSMDFDTIPSWVDRITVVLDAVSTNGTSPLMFQLGSTTFTATGYKGTSSFIGATTVSSVINNTGFFLTNWTLAALDGYGTIVFTNISGNTWVASGNISAVTTVANWVVSGSIALSGVLDRVRITTVGGANTFDAGTINILYE